MKNFFFYVRFNIWIIFVHFSGDDFKTVIRCFVNKTLRHSSDLNKRKHCKLLDTVTHKSLTLLHRYNQLLKIYRNTLTYLSDPDLWRLWDWLSLSLSIYTA